ncbi:histidine phosphatase family protein [Wenxinia marina]|uniref:Fructose-2,6-bisphosphatase n=1 Tax=Wenxinia marina DSM 24838 TaxID=1123501 RepID=A0A0D0Q7N8_9RHOB|nr:histidine phosphatase family protein [Wenxinia marina]KIQ70479.1 Fructose-2,6-bisphosphatase [Wenxinia marina DSM 24838]GGL52790.1 hypothetical protein GCM10011392_03970 [Wenxinia marina]
MDRRTWLGLAAGLLVAACAPAAPPDRAWTIIVLRHADRDGWADALTPAERARAAALPEALAGEPISAILIPDRQRNRDTAAALAADRGLTPVVYRGFDLPGALVAASGPEGAAVWVGNQRNLAALWAELGAPGLPPATYGQIAILEGGGPEGSVRRRDLTYGMP